MSRIISVPDTVNRFLMRRQRLLIGGNWLDALSGETFTTENPATGETLSTLASAQAEDVDLAVRAAQAAFPLWSSTSVATRERLMHRFADLLEAHADELAMLETLDNGKIFAATRDIDVPSSIAQLRYYAGWPSKLTGEIYPVSIPGYQVYGRREPLGVCAVITLWNLSLLMAVQKVGPALAAGNTVILKPAEQTSLTALRLGELALEAGLPAGVLNVVTGYDAEAGCTLSQHPGVAKVSFTGSTEGGREIMRSAADGLKRVTLELGGKSPLVIFADTDLEAAANAAFWGTFGNGGQNCVAASRLYVEKPVYARLLERLSELAHLVKVGPGLDKNSELGPLISGEQLRRVTGFVDTGRRQGRLVCGGGRPAGPLARGYFLQPTIFADLPDHALVGTEEIFGPVLSVFSFESEAEVLQRANALPCGLVAAIWTGDVDKAHRMAAKLRASVVWVNTYDWFDPPVPFGGSWDSGRELGRQIMESYTELKSIRVRVKDPARAAPIETRVVENPMRDHTHVGPESTSPRWYHERLPGYAPTPLHNVPSLAEKFGVGRVLVKDESERLGLPAFKMLGASWAIYRALSERLGHEPRNWKTVQELGALFAPLKPLTLATATDGNHGRAVARTARLLGLQSRIWVPANTAQPRIDAIKDEGAFVTVSTGSYDEAVMEAAATAHERTVVVSDTSWPGYEHIPQWVIEGYTTILEEIDEQLAGLGVETPDAVFIPVGVGAFAAAVAGHYRRSKAARPLLVAGEPVDAACVLESVQAGRIVTLAGLQRSIMAGLNCGTPSAVAWPAVSRGFDLFVTATDSQAVEAMRAFAKVGIRAGESGAASLAALANLVSHPINPLSEQSTVVLVSTEGVTDPEFYEREVVNGAG